MEPTRELDQIRAELNRLHDRTSDIKINATALEATTEQRFNHIILCLEALKKDLESVNGSVASLQMLASEGQTSLRTLLWLGGVVAGITAFLIMLYELFAK